MLESPLDPLLAIGILAVAGFALSSRSLFTAVVLFIVFGLLMSLAWVRLEAPDIALAEAAIGAGITGALLLDAAGQMGSESRERRRPFLVRGLAAAATLGLAAILVRAIGQLPLAPGGLTARAMGTLAESGVSNPVTAVLLNFRSYDTWLEIAVLLVAVVSVLALGRRVSFEGVVAPRGVDPMLRGMVSTLLPVLILVGGYLLWRGTHAPGGAFQGGAVLGSAGVLLLLARYRALSGMRGFLLRGALVAGLLGFLFAALGLLSTGRRFLELPADRAGGIILAVEITVTLSIALTLTALFAGARTRGPGGFRKGSGE